MLLHLEEDGEWPVMKNEAFQRWFTGFLKKHQHLRTIRLSIRIVLQKRPAGMN